MREGKDSVQKGLPHSQRGCVPVGRRTRWQCASMAPCMASIHFACSRSDGRQRVKDRSLLLTMIPLSPSGKRLALTCHVRVAGISGRAVEGGLWLRAQQWGRNHVHSKAEHVLSCHSG